MGNCLITKLKAVVNNPNLPILETMQQFTLDAIAASGNSDMTDVQKGALNHFFYQLGKFDNGAIWNKIVGLAMPVICGDNIATAFTNYKDLTVIAGDSRDSFSDHGYVSGGYKTEYGSFSGSSYDLSVVVSIINKTGGGNFSLSKSAGVYSGSTPSSLIIKSTSSNFSVNLQNLIDVYGNTPKSTVDVAGSISNQSGVVNRALDNGQILVGTQSGERQAETQYSNASMYINGSALAPICISITAKAFTEAELEKVMFAVKDLKDAFVAST